MRRTRFSIAGLMGFVLIAALGFGGLKNSTPIWASACYSLTLLALVVAVLFAIQSRGGKRAFCVGFSVVGWVYLALGCLNPWATDYLAPPQLLTTMLLKNTESLIFPETSNNAFFYIGGSSAIPTPVPPPMIATMPTPPTPVAPAEKEEVPPIEGVVGVPVPAEAMQPPAPTPSAAYPPVVTSSTATATSNATIGNTLTPAPIMVSGGLSVNYSLGVSTITATLNNDASPISFHHIGQSLTTLLLAYAGGILSVFLAARRERNEANLNSEASPTPP